MLGLTLGGGSGAESLRTSPSAPLFPAPEEGEDGDARMNLLDAPSPSPPSSPEPTLSVAAPSSSSFRDPFAIDDSLSVVEQPVVAEPEMYVSPRDAQLDSRSGRPSSALARSDGVHVASGLTAPASPPLPAYAPRPEARLLPQPVVVVEASAAGSSRASSSSPGATAAAPLPAVGSRKGSIGVFISSILGRRGSRPLTAL